MIKIIKKDNKKYKFLKKLLISKGRKEFKKFLVEGKKFLAFNPQEIFVDEFYKIDQNHKNITILSNELFKKISSHQNSQGVICLFEMKQAKDIKTDFILILDRIRDPGNLGTIIRTAEFLGIKDIILLNCVDLYNPKVIRATMGAIFNINFLNGEIEQIISLKNKGYKLISTSSYESNSSLLEELDFNEKIAIILGNESEGIDKILLENSDLKITIPSLGFSESLNVACACSIIIYSIIIKRKSIKF